MRLTCLNVVRSRTITACVLAIVLPAKSLAQHEHRSMNYDQYRTLGTRTDRSAGLSIGDVDGDGDLDIVFANGRHWAEQNELFLNNGEGYFLVARDVGAERDSSYAVPLADFDGDGDLDLAVGNDRVRSLILFNDGRGHFLEAGTVGPGNVSTRKLTVADVNADGHIDIVMANRHEPNAVYLNDSKGRFEQSHTFGTKADSTIAIAIGDLNGDAAPDLALANRNGRSNYIYLNDGEGKFNERHAYGTGHDNTVCIHQPVRLQ